MAIGKHLRDELTLILEMDDSVKDGYEAYVASGFDESKLKLAGEPTRFKLQRMTYDQRQRAQDMTSIGDRTEFVVRCCLLSIVGYRVTHGNGTVTEAPPVQHEESAQWKRPIVKREWLQSADLPTSVMRELAAAGSMLSEGSIPFFAPSAPQSTPGATAKPATTSEAA